MRRKDETSKTRKILHQLQKLPANRSCAECSSKQPTWASTNLGVFVCIRCSSVHRAMGTHISKVKSATLDIWKMETVEHFKDQGGNKKVNSFYEANLPPEIKPVPGSDMYLVERFIRDKYERKAWYSKKKSKSKSKSKSRAKSKSVSDSDGTSSEESESSESSFKSAKVKRKKKKVNKKGSKRREKNSEKRNIRRAELTDTSLEVKDEHVDEKVSKIVLKKKVKKSPAKQHIEQVVDILDVSVLSFGDEPEREKTGFDSKTFVDSLLSGEVEPSKKTSETSASNVDFGEFFGSPSKDLQNPAVSPPQSSAKPNRNDIMGMFKMKSPVSDNQRHAVDIFGAAAPRAHSMHPMGLQGPTMQTLMVGQPASIQNVQFRYPPGLNQPVINQNLMYGPMYNQVVSSQTNTMNLNKSRQSGFSNPQQLGFTNPEPRTEAFSSLMSGNVPIKSQPHSVKSSSSRHVPSKATGSSLNIDLNGWMN